MASVTQFILQVRLTSPCLGELLPDDKGVRRFKRSPRQNIAVNTLGWHQDLTQAGAVIDAGLRPRKTIIPPEDIMPASLHIYQNTISGGRVECFECMRSGTILTMPIGLRPDRPGCPSQETLKRILVYTGLHCGISQWGRRFGFGRFTIVNLYAKCDSVEDASSAAGQ